MYVFSSPVLILANYRYAEYIDGTMVPVCLTQADTFWSALYFILIISLFFALPMAILVILYTVIACHLMANPGIVAPCTSSAALRYRRQVIIMLGTVVLLFFLCLLPFRAFTLWIILESSEAMFSLGVEKYYFILYFSRCMLYLNSAINPILYNLMSSKFRDGFSKLLGFRKIDKMRLKRRCTLTTTTTISTNSSQKKTSPEQLFIYKWIIHFCLCL
uniref:G-protein coupled receptors family 1 profile domain-containing protein n=1 Tax=Clastoptera arizonana TaxID=38151 RepID=A0A1B6CHX8_9HEMI